MKLLSLAGVIYFAVDTYTIASAAKNRTAWFYIFIAFRIFLILYLTAAFLLLP